LSSSTSNKDNGTGFSALSIHLLPQNPPGVLTYSSGDLSFA
jgi:hypothetical protein